MNIIDLTNIQITQIHARHIDSFVEIFQADDGTWRCRLKLKNGSLVPQSKWQTLNEYQLNNEARMLLYAHISKNKKVASAEPIIAPAIEPEAIKSTPATSAEIDIKTINHAEEIKQSNFKAQSNFKTRKL